MSFILTKPGRYRSIFTEEIVDVVLQKETRVLLLSGVIAHFPVALLERLEE